MKKIFLIASLFGFANFMSAQKYFTKSGKISFDASTKMEEIAAVNNKATAVYDATTGAIEYAVLIKAFAFEKALMQEHFNENYMESDKYPKAIFKGNIVNFAAIKLSKDGTFNAEVEGKLTMHGVTKDIKTESIFTVKGGQVSVSSNFRVLLADYNISIPALVKDNISKEMKIEVRNTFELLK